MGFGGNSGGGSISSASDVALSSVQNNNVLAYDSTTAKWKNKTSTHTISEVTGLNTALSQRIPAVIIEESEVDNAATLLAGYPVPTVVYIVPNGSRTW